MKKSEKSQDIQDVRITNTTLEATIESMFAGLMYFSIISVVVFILLFVPVIYFNTDSLKELWLFIVSAFWFSAIVGLSFYYMQIYFIDKVNNFIYIFSFVSIFVIWAMSIILGLLQLFPLENYINIVYVITAYMLIYISMLLDSILRYKNYLVKSIKYSSTNAKFFFILGSYFAIHQFANLLSFLSGNSQSDLSNFGIDIIEIISIFVLLNFVLDFRLNDPSGNIFKGLMTIIVSVSMLIIHYINYEYIDLFWVGTLTFLTSVFYVAYNPTQRKTNVPAYLLYFVFALMLSFYANGVVPKFEDIASILTSNILTLGISIASLVVSTVAIIPPIVTTLGKYFGENQNKNNSILINEVKNACDEIFETDGVNLESIENIMSISIINQNFNYCENLIKQEFQAKTGKDKLFPLDGDVIFYFYIYFLCSKYFFESTIPVLRGENWNGKKEITDGVEFGQYLLEQLPSKIHNRKTWVAYTNNKIIKKYLNEQMLRKKMKIPNSLWSKTKQILYTAVIFFVISSMVLQSGGSVVISSLPNIVNQAASWALFHVNEVRLIFVDEFKPYLNMQEAEKINHGRRHYVWINTWLKYKLEHIPSDIGVTSEEIEKVILWLEDLYSYYTIKDYTQESLIYLLIYLNSINNNCQKASNYFNILINESYNQDWKNNLSEEIEKCEN